MRAAALKRDYALYLTRAIDELLTFPCHPAIAPGVCGCSAGARCRNVGKHPLTLNGLKDASRDPTQIEDWWQCWPDANPAGTCLPARPLAWIDIDRDEGGFAAWEELTGRLRIGAEVEKTVISLTGGGGNHFWFHPTKALRNSAGRLGPGLDVRSAGGYVVLPPSTHRSGNRYRFQPGHSPADLPIAPMPPRLEASIAGLESKPHTTERKADTAPEPYTVPADAGEVESALAYVGADDRDTWLKVGMALHRDVGTAGRAIWDRWSQSSAKFDAQDQEYTWAHFKSTGAVGLRTVFRFAVDAGWRTGKAT